MTQPFEKFGQNVRDVFLFNLHFFASDVMERSFGQCDFRGIFVCMTYSSSTSVDSGLSITDLKRSTSAEKNIFERMMISRKDPTPGPPKEVLTVKDGLTIEDEKVVKAMTQFRGKSPKEGTIDVYW